ncbi:hypothetical protein NMG60_11029409 [Bertholletia excelsa]
MALFSSVFGCLMPSSSRVNDDAGDLKKKAASPEKRKSVSRSSSQAPIVMSYFPVNSQMSRL